MAVSDAIPAADRGAKKSATCRASRAQPNLIKLSAGSGPPVNRTSPPPAAQERHRRRLRQIRRSEAPGVDRAGAAPTFSIFVNIWASVIPRSRITSRVFIWHMY